MAEPEIITEMDAFALELLGSAREKNEGAYSNGLADRLATFNSIGKWLSIKHGLEDSDGAEGAQLHDLKSRLKGDDDRPAYGRSTAGERYRPPAKGKRCDGADPDEPDAGTGLAKLRAKLPVVGNGANNRGFRRIGRNPGGAPFAPASGGGSVPADLSGGAESVSDGISRSGDVRRDDISAANLAVRAEGLINAGTETHEESDDPEAA